jgi:hypothetical protein
MGANYLGNIKILGAAFFSVALIVGAYVVARDAESPATAQASSEAELLKQIAARDTDTDGLRDWEEALYGTDPRVADTRKLGMTDGQAVAKGLIVPTAPANVGTTSTSPSAFDPSIPVPAEGTITRALSVSFFTNYMRALEKSPDGNLSETELKKLSDDILLQLSDSIDATPEFRTRESLKVAGSGPEAMKIYAASAEAIFRANKTTAKKTDIAYLKLALEEGDVAALTHIASIAKIYRDTAVGLAALPVPQELVNDHLLLINTTARMSKITEDFTRAESDPFATLLALKQYPEAIKNLGTAFINIHKTYSTAGVILAPGEPGAAFVLLVEKVAANQRGQSSIAP